MDDIRRLEILIGDESGGLEQFDEGALLEGGPSQDHIAIAREIDELISESRALGLKTMPSRQLEVYIDEQSGVAPAETARRMRVTRPRVHQLRKAALRHMGLCGLFVRARLSPMHRGVLHDLITQVPRRTTARRWGVAIIRVEGIQARFDRYLRSLV